MSTTWKQVVLDVADAWREANDSTAKIPVGELPNKVKEGGENIDPELTTLEGTLQEILDILPFKGAMASGQYVWKKLTAEGGEFLDYVVSNDAEAYPDGGMRDGFYYELFEEGGNAEYGEVVLTAASPSITISHSLKQIPAHVGLIKKDLKRVLNLTWAIVDENLQVMGSSYTSYDYTTTPTKTEESVTFAAVGSYKFAATTYVWFVSK